MADDKYYYCEKCHKTLKGDAFYTSRRLDRYPDDGKMPICKDCMTMHVDNWDPETFKPILEEIDVPYIPDEWNKLLAKYANRPEKITGATILGRYLSKMKLAQYKNYRWKDNDFIQEMADAKLRQTMQRQGYEEADIQKALQEGRIPAPEKPENEWDPQQPYQLSNQVDMSPEDDLNLSEEDIRYLRLKWGKTYRPEEWVQLEQLYNDMVNSYDIQTAGHKDTLKMLCKTSLKANQLLDLGDVDGYQKMQKAYDSLMKSGKFTAVQNKTESGDFVDSIAEIVAICEKDGFIPRYYVEEPKDKVDRVLQDLQAYTRSLIMDEMNLGVLIEKAVKDIEEQKEKEARPDVDEEIEDETGFEDELFADLNPENKPISNEDYEEFNDFLDSQEE